MFTDKFNLDNIDFNKITEKFRGILDIIKKFIYKLMLIAVIIFCAIFVYIWLIDYFLVYKFNYLIIIIFN